MSKAGCYGVARTGGKQGREETGMAGYRGGSFKCQPSSGFPTDSVEVRCPAQRLALSAVAGSVTTSVSQLLTWPQLPESHS